MRQNKISLFIPIYNEGGDIANHISKIKNAMEKTGKNYEIIIVDDNSSDNSEKICKKIARNGKKIRYIRHHTGPSRRENLALSFKKAKGSIIAYMDADLAVDLFYIKRLFEEIENGADIAIGSRYKKGSYIKRTFLRFFISQLYNAFIRFYFNSKIVDHQCGFKAFKKKAILDLTDDLGYDDTFKRGWLWDAEMLIRAQKKGYKIVEFPVVWRHGQKSEFDFKRELKLISYMTRLKRTI